MIDDERSLNFMFVSVRNVYIKRSGFTQTLFNLLDRIISVTVICFYV